jgi:signal transduction histidine kinase
MRKWWKQWRISRNELFNKAQRHLMWLYSGLIMIFLATFITIVYIVVSRSVVDTQMTAIQNAAKQQATTLATSLSDQSLTADELRDVRAARRVEGLFFYYIADGNGKLIHREEPYEIEQENLLTVIKNWKPTEQEYRRADVELDFSDVEEAVEQHEESEEHEKEEHEARASIQPDLLIDEDQEDFKLMIIAQPVFKNDTLIGMIYMGKDVTASESVLNKLLMVLFGFGFVFLMIVFPLSYWMSRRAMKPIKVSYERQREFVADASHELRTPLSILQSSLDVVEEENAEQLTPFAKRVLGDMRDELRRMTKLVADLLTLARADSGQPQINPTRYDLTPSVAQVVRNVQTLAQPKNLKVDYQVPDQLELFADRERIEQLLYILMENAVKYTPNDGAIQLAVRVDDDMRIPVVEMRVTDTGVGIPSEDVAHVFERFYRVDKHRAKQVGGSGLGLSIAKWIVEAHDGTISVTSEVGRGTTFTVTLPLFPN